MILYLMLGIAIGMNIGVWFSVYLMKKAYDPFIKELKESITYWYNYRTK